MYEKQNMYVNMKSHYDLHEFLWLRMHQLYNDTGNKTHTYVCMLMALKTCYMRVCMYVCY